jgi:hypothetical protein
MSSLASPPEFRPPSVPTRPARRGVQISPHPPRVDDRRGKMDPGNVKRKRANYETGADAIEDFAKGLDAEASARARESHHASRDRGGDGSAPGPAGSSAGGSTALSYLPSRSFTGARPGYYFRLGNQGPGYYLDARGKAKSAAAAAAAALDAGGGNTSMAGEETTISNSKPPPGPRRTADELLADAEENAGGDAALDLTNLDEKAVRKLVLAFERKYATNQAMRLKHADDPAKFIDSEVDLDEEVKRLQRLAGYPDLYPEFVRLNAVPSILALLAHDNPDIAADAVELLHELVDADAVEVRSVHWSPYDRVRVVNADP